MQQNKWTHTHTHTHTTWLIQMLVNHFAGNPGGHVVPLLKTKREREKNPKREDINGVYIKAAQPSCERLKEQREEERGEKKMSGAKGRSRKGNVA